MGHSCKDKKYFKSCHIHSAWETRTLLSFVRSPHVLNFDSSNSLLQTLGVSVEKQTKARAATAAKEHRLRQTRFDRHYLRHPHHASQQVIYLEEKFMDLMVLLSAEDAAKMPLRFFSFLNPDWLTCPLHS